MAVSRVRGATPVLLVVLVAAACRRSRPPENALGYTARTRELTVTAVPLLVSETRTLYPFLAADFARGGVLEGKEVYAFSPSTFTVVEGDTVHFTLINPEDDEHSFALPDCTDLNGGSFVPPDCAVRLPGQRVTEATYLAREPGVYAILCTMAKHLPMMQGQLVVLATSAVAESSHRP